MAEVDLCPACQEAVDADPNYPYGLVENCPIDGPPLTSHILKGVCRDPRTMQCRHMALSWDKEWVRCDNCNFFTKKTFLKAVAKKHQTQLGKAVAIIVQSINLGS